MASKRIKGLTVEIGGDTTKLGKALEGVEAKSRGLSGELRDVERLLKFDTSNTELLAQKQDILAEAIEGAKDKLDILKEAEKQVQRQFEKGEASEEQVRELKREIIKATQELEAYEDKADKAAKAVEDVGDESKKTERASEKLTDTLGTLGKVGLMGLVGAATTAIGTLSGVVEASEEYRREMGKLDTAFETSGFNAETAYDTYSDLQSVLGETDQAVEAANHLAKLADTEEELQELTDALTGVYATFGSSLPLEGLAEAANETAKVGAVTGSFADAINWAADEGTDWKKILGQNKKALGAFEKAIAEGEKAEDAYTAALEACSDEQERQQLITETLTELYGEAGDVYKETNAEIIASNEATEKLNKTWAKLGKKAAPIVTTFKEGVAELGETIVESLDEEDIADFQNTIKDGFNSISKNVIPGLVEALKWVMDNLDTLTSLAGGFVAALAVGKIASIATSIGTTLVSAIKSATSAQKGLNAAASANPYILLTQVIVGLGVAFGNLVNDHLDKVKEEARLTAEQVYGLSEAEAAARDRANEAADAFNRQRDSLQQTVNGANAHFDYLGTLKDELFNLADATGRVHEKDKIRAEFILGQLNEALGTEYTLTGNQIQQYQTLASEIDNVIEKKKAELLLSSTEDVYATALKGKAQAEKDYYQNLFTWMDLKAERDTLMAEAKELGQKADDAFWAWEKTKYQEKQIAVLEQLKFVQETLDEQGVAYEGSKTTLQGYYDTIGQYETANMQLLEGNTEEASKILSDLGYYYDNYAADVGHSTDEVQTQWEMQVIDAGLKAKHIRAKWENGVEGYTEDMVKEAEESYEEMIAAYADAHKDAESVGGDISDGLSFGMEVKEGVLFTKARNLVNGIFDAMRDEADSNSPSRRAIGLTEDIGEGAEIGLDNKTEDVAAAGARQIDALMQSYAAQEQRAADALSSVTLQSNNAQLGTQQAAAAEQRELLGRILEAVEQGQVIALDGDKVVGGTVNRTDAALGQIRILAARGAV